MIQNKKCVFSGKMFSEFYLHLSGAILSEKKAFIMMYVVMRQPNIPDRFYYMNS